MTPHQQFRQGDKVISIEVRHDNTTGKAYSRITDIRKFFPGAAMFNANGVFLNYLEDEHEQVYEPERIAHYPNDIIDIVAAHAPLSPPVTLSTALTESGNINHPSPLYSSGSIDFSMSSLSLQPLPSSTSSALVRPAVQYLPSSSASSNIVALQAASLTRPMAMLSTMELGITQLQQQLERSTDQQSVHHQQLLQQLIDMMAQQNELVRQQNVMLQEQAASKEREEKILQEQAESKLREEQMLKMQQETIDRLIMNQQRVDAILVQNYELHEYPIPRLFVVLPDSFSDWDPRNFLVERFRLYFLCECSDDCGSSPSQGASSYQLDITTESSTNPIPIKNSIHLAKHKGYEISRPTEFFDQYGPCVLGMLRILQYCLAVAAVAAPVAALVDRGLKDVMDSVKSISESAVEAVNMSINILETKLGDNDVGDNLAATASCGQEDNNMFENLAALEGADLRCLDTFLRNNDKDKILGNLYRITTEQGHVKWVCFEHYKETYRHTALSSFVQAVETADGIYDPHLGHVTITLKPGTTSKDFFRRLVSQAPAVQTLDVTLDWDFGSSDLVIFVDLVAKSKVKVMKVDLQDDHTSNSTIASLRPGKGRYHSLLGLLSNTKLRSLQLSNLYLLATRTSNLPSNFTASWLLSFSFHGLSNNEDKLRLMNIISHCPKLVELRLISQRKGSEWVDLSLRQAVFSLKKLRRLHLVAWRASWTNLRIEESIVKESTIKGLGLITELIYTVEFLNNEFLTKMIRRSGSSLEILVLYDDFGCTIDLTPEDPLPAPLHAVSEQAPTIPISSHAHLVTLTHLDLQVDLTDESLQYLSTILPHLSLVHIGCGRSTTGLLLHCNFASLKSLSIVDAQFVNMKLVLDATANGNAAPSFDRLKQLYLHGLRLVDEVLTKFLQSVQLTRLYLNGLTSDPLTAILKVANFLELQEVSICDSHYEPSAEHALVGKVDKFTESLVIQLEKYSSQHYGERRGSPRTTAGSPGSLPLSRVKKTGKATRYEHHYRFLHPTLPAH